MHFEFDPDADAVYVNLREPGPAAKFAEVARTQSLDSQRRVDYDAEGVAIGVEFTSASRGIDLEGVPDAEGVAALLRCVQELRLISPARS